jgi:beta-glucanase (GH16 family)
MPRFKDFLLALLLIPSLSVAAMAHETPPPYRIGGQWEAIFADEFDSAELDRTKWTTCYWWDQNGCTNLGNSNLNWYLPANVKVADGVLTLTAREQRARGYRGRTFDYTSGIVTTGRYDRERQSATRFATTYGFFEIRAKIPSGRGLWPAFWLLPTTHRSKPEIDVMEVIGHRPNYLEMHLHWQDGWGRSRSEGHSIRTDDLSRGWHRYGLLWSPDVIVWYLDGREVWRFTNQSVIPHEPMYVLLNLAVGGNWPGPPDSRTRFPAEFQIDYLRVWRDMAR